MGSLSDYGETAMVDHLCGTAYTAVATVYLALATAAPNDATTGATLTEANYTSYARTAITFGAAASRQVVQSGVVTFPQATGGSSDCTHWAVLDGSTLGAGNILCYGALNETKSVVNGNTPSVASSEVNVTISAGFISDYAANNFLDLMFRNQVFAAPTTRIVLTTATITDADTGVTITEVANANGYARVTVNLAGGASPAWNAAATGATDNANAITFATATGSWGTVVAAGATDNATHGAGNLLFYDNGVTDQAVSTDDVVEFAIGNFNVSMS